MAYCPCVQFRAVSVSGAGPADRLTERNRKLTHLLRGGGIFRFDIVFRIVWIVGENYFVDPKHVVASSRLKFVVLRC